MIDILNELSASAETGVLPETIDRAIEEIERLRAERDKLIQAVADHVTVRAEQYQRIKNLKARAHDHLVLLGAERNRALKAEQERDTLREHLDRVTWALEFLLERGIEPPDRNCSCHISPPCNDCVEWSGLREAVEHAESALAAVREHAGEGGA